MHTQGHVFRLYTIFRIKGLKVLNFKKVSVKVRPAPRLRRQ